MTYQERSCQGLEGGRRKKSAKVLSPWVRDRCGSLCEKFHATRQLSRIGISAYEYGSHWRLTLIQWHFFQDQTFTICVGASTSATSPGNAHKADDRQQKEGKVDRRRRREKGQGQSWPMRWKRMKVCIIFIRDFSRGKKTTLGQPLGQYPSNFITQSFMYFVQKNVAYFLLRKPVLFTQLYRSISAIFLDSVHHLSISFHLSYAASRWIVMCQWFVSVSSVVLYFGVVESIWYLS